VVLRHLDNAGKLHKSVKFYSDLKPPLVAKLSKKTMIVEATDKVLEMNLKR
jgi:hypothetical protein